MSRQLVDSAVRTLKKAISLIEAEKYEKALENLGKAERLAEKAKSQELLCSVLLRKGEALASTQALDEALETCEKALAISSRLFLNEPRDSTPQKYLYNSLGLIGNTLQEMDNVSVAEASYERTNKYFDGIFEAYEKLITAQPENPDYLSNYLKTLINFRGYLFSAGHFEKQIPLINSTLEAFQKILYVQPENLKIYQSLDSLVKEFGEELLENELFEDAKKLYEQLQRIYRALLEKYPDNKLALHYLIFSYGHFGDLYLEQGELDKMEEVFRQALSMVEDNLSKDPESTAFLVNRSEIYEEFGLRFSKAGDFEKANRYYEKALENFENMIGKHPDDLDYQSELSNAFAYLGELFGKIKRIESAKKCYMHKIEINESLLEKDPEDEDIKLDIIDTFMMAGYLYKRTGEAGETEPAKECFEKAIEGYEELLAEDPEEIDFVIGVADALNAIGDLYSKVGPEDMEPEDWGAEDKGLEYTGPEDAELETAREYYEKALKLNEKALEVYPDDETFQEVFIRTLTNLGDSFAAQERYEDTIRFYRRIVDIREQAVRDNPEGWLDIKILIGSLYQFGPFYGEIGEAELEKEQYSKAVELFSRVLHNEKLSLPVRLIFVTDVQFRGIDLLNSRKYDSAKEALDLALKFSESLYEKDPENPDNYPYVCEALSQSGRLQMALKNFEEAAKTFDSLLPIVEKLLESDPERPEAREKAGTTYTDAGEVYYLTGNYEKSKEVFGRALALNAALLDEEPDSPIYKINQAETFENYAKLLSKLGRNEEAEEFAAKSKEIHRKLAEEDTG